MKAAYGQQRLLQVPVAPVRQTANRKLQQGWKPSTARRSTLKSCVAAVAEQEQELGKFISSTPIPAFIPREVQHTSPGLSLLRASLLDLPLSIKLDSFVQDLMNQLFGWARIECHDAGAEEYGLPLKVRPVNKEETGELWGFIISILSREGANVTDIRVMFDNEPVTKHQWVGRGGDGFPTLEGNETLVIGNELIIRKIDDNLIDEQTRSAIKTFCVKLVEAINKYYAFGSCYVDDST